MGSSRVKSAILWQRTGERWSSNPRIKEEIQRVEKKLADTGRVLVRASGTEPKIRVMLEGEDGDLIRKLANRIARAVKEAMS